MEIAISSCTAGFISRICCHPIDTCKARIQSTQSGIGMNLKTCFSHIWKTEGIGGLYRGIGIAAVGSAPAGCLYLSTYEYSKKILAKAGLGDNMRFLPDFMSGFMAETVSCSLWVPIDVIKERLQVQGKTVSGRYLNSIHAIQTVSKLEGIRGLYKGYLSTLASFGPFSAFHFLFYEQLKTGVLIIKGKDTSGQSRAVSGIDGLICGGLASSLAAAITNPLDLVKLRLQVQRSHAANGEISKQFSYNYPSMRVGLSSIIKEDGWKALFRGVGARALFAGPQAALTMAIFEETRSRLLNTSL